MFLAFVVFATQRIQESGIQNIPYVALSASQQVMPKDRYPEPTQAVNSVPLNFDSTANIQKTEPTFAPQNTSTKTPILTNLSSLDNNPQPTLTTRSESPSACRDSLPLRLHANQRGQTILDRVKFRLSLTSEDGFDLIKNTQFITTGEPQCAYTGGDPHKSLMWRLPVRLENNAAKGQKGWIAESGLWNDNLKVYNVEPR